MLLDESVAAIFPPNGGEVLIDILPFIDFAALAAAPPKWILGYSDMSAFQVPYTLLTRHASLNGTNLWESPIDPTSHRTDCSWRRERRPSWAGTTRDTLRE